MVTFCEKSQKVTMVPLKKTLQGKDEKAKLDAIPEISKNLDFKHTLRA